MIRWNALVKGPGGREEEASMGKVAELLIAISHTLSCCHKSALSRLEGF